MKRVGISRPAVLNQEIAAYLRDLVMTGELRPGDSLNIEQLARELGTSTTPVREALLALTGEGFVQVQPRRGFRVSALSRADLEDLYLVQAQLAGELAARAAVNASQADLTRVDQIQADLEAAAERPDHQLVEELNRRFHSEINRCADSPKISWLLGLVVSYVPRRGDPLIPGWITVTLTDHPAILEALHQGDAGRARAEMENHIRHTAALLVKDFESKGLWGRSDVNDDGRPSPAEPRDTGRDAGS